MIYKKYFNIVFALLLVPLISLIGSGAVFAEVGSGYTGSGLRDFTVGLKIVNPARDWNRPMQFIITNDLIPKTMTLGEYVSNHLKESDSSLDVNQVSKSSFMALQTFVYGGDVPFIANGVPKNKQYWIDAAKASGLSPEQIAQVAELYDKAKAAGLDIVDGKTTYMFEGMGGATLNRKPRNPNFVYCDVSEGEKFKKNRTVDSELGSVKGVYAVYAELNPVEPKNFSSLSAEQQAEWKRTHQPQKTEPIKTAFAEYLDRNKDTLAKLKEYGKSGGVGENSKYRTEWESFLAGAREAASQPLPKVNIQVSETNKEGMNKGGVYTYTEYTKDASVATNGKVDTVVHSQDLYDEYGCVDVEYKASYTDKDGKRVNYTYTRSHYQKIASNRQIDGNYTKPGVVSIVGHNFKPGKSWQFISVRCNQVEFNNLVASTGSTVIQNGKASSSAQSPIVEGTNAKFYNNLDVSFFYSGKSCDDIWGCTVEPNNGAGNDSANNKAKRGDLINNLFGAQSDGKTSSKFVMFRDNVSRSIRNDVAWLQPINSTPEAALDSKKPASATYLLLDKNGTPNKDLFNLENSSRTTIISGNDLATNPARVFKSQENVFFWRASWASDSDKPHRMNIRYAYKPQVTAAIKTAFDRDGGANGNNTFTLDIICPNKFNTEGTWNPTVINQPKNLDYGQPQTNFDDSDNSYLEVNFVKTSAEQG